MRGNAFKGDIFQQSSMICIGRHVGGHTLALQHGGQNYFLLISCLTFDSYAQVSFKCYHIIFSTFCFKCKICVQKEVIHNFKKSHFGQVTSYELTHFRKLVRAWKAKSLLFYLRYDLLIVFGRQNHIAFIFITTMSRDSLVQMAYSSLRAVVSTLRWERNHWEQPFAFPSSMRVHMMTTNIQQQDGNENFNQTIRLISKTTTLHLHHAFIFVFCHFCTTMT